MTLEELLGRLRRIYVLKSAPEVCRTVAGDLRERFAPHAEIRIGKIPPRLPKDCLRIGVEGSPEDRGVRFESEDGSRSRLSASHARYLFAFYSWLVETHAKSAVSRVSRTRPLRPAFRWHRPVFDLYFTMSGRTVRNLDREAYVREMARAGFTHLEVNSLAFPEGAEKGVDGEVYPRFYTYCPALDQFVSSELNRGIYPKRYLSQNLKRLKDGCRLAAKYGLVPTMTCFEPRSVPDALLEKYPELRGCRVDHPFRSFKPRYNLAVSHPVVKEHYRELMQNLMREAPELGCLSVWTNDSGAGFEFTRSLYVGANGSAYLVREWSDEDIFAKAAAENATGFLRLLKDAAAEVNPDFRVTTRLEPFGPEREAVVDGLGDGVDVEVPTLLTTGWDSPYGHPEYGDCEIGPFTIYNHRFHPEERPPMRRLAERDCRTHVLFGHGPVNNFEPLLGIPSPWLTHEKASALAKAGAEYLAHWGGVAPPASAPWDVNAEVFRRFQFDRRGSADTVAGAIATAWVGRDRALDLVAAWRRTERAIRGFMPNPLYFLWGVWYRLQIRPLVPDIEAILKAERAYYEDHLLSTHHNPNRVDLSRDVLFHLMSPELAGRTVRRIDRHALPVLDDAIDGLRGVTGEHEVFADLFDRLRALRCWMATRRSVATWIHDVHGYLDTRGKAKRAACRKRLAKMVKREIANAKDLLTLWNESRVEFMAVSAEKETTFLYGDNFGEHLKRKIDLMERYGDAEPRIDPDIIWRVRNLRRPNTRDRRVTQIPGIGGLAATLEPTTPAVRGCRATASPPSARRSGDAGSGLP